MNRTVAVTGGSGKLGRAVVAAICSSTATTVVELRPACPSPRAAEHASSASTSPTSGRPSRRCPGSTTATTALDARRAPGRHSRRRRVAPNAVTFDNNVSSSYNVFSRPPSCRASATSCGPRARRCSVCPFDNATAVASRSTRSTQARARESAYSLAKLVDETMAGAVLPLGPRAEDDRAALLQRHGRRRLRATSRPSTPTRAPAQVEPVGLHRRPRRRAGRRARRWSTTSPGLDDLHHRQRRHRHEPAVGGAGRRGLPGTEFRAPVEGTQSLCSIDKARRLLGYEPQHSWRDHAPA